ncbi:SGNH/GDSL hydrolase family protein [Candidatus Nitrospira nitrosa]|nr:SGNH/GDSL hydrolase family protein [Candidatus Nitrospira nitrosa]
MKNYRRISAGLAMFTVVGSVLSSLLIIEIALRFLPVCSSMQKLPVDQHNPILRFPSNQRFTYAKGWNFEILNYGRFNNYGFVNNQDYQSNPEDLLLAVIGDSYVEALMVPYEQSLQGRLAELYKGKGKVYSFGISGSQLAQYVAMAEYVWREFHPQGLVFVIIGNDFDESLVQVRSGLHLFKRHSQDQSLSLIRTDYQPTVLETILKHSAVVRYLWSTVGVGDLTRLPQWFTRSEVLYVGNTSRDASLERVRDSRLVVDSFFSELSRRVELEPARIQFVVDGMRPQLYSPEDLLKAQGSYFDLIRQYFIETAILKGYEVIDLQSPFIARHDKDGARFEFPTDGHWNGLGHQVAADAVSASNLAKMVSTYPGPTAQTIR